jgi:hypothetical protein
MRMAVECILGPHARAHAAAWVAKAKYTLVGSDEKQTLAIKSAYLIIWSPAGHPFPSPVHARFCETFPLISSLDY